MLVRSKEGEYEVIDAREVAPTGAGEGMFEGNVGGSVKGGLARWVLCSYFPKAWSAEGG